MPIYTENPHCRGLTKINILIMSFLGEGEIMNTELKFNQSKLENLVKNSEINKKPFLFENALLNYRYKYNNAKKALNNKIENSSK